MKNGQRGAALAYAVMLTVLVFAICMAVLTVMLSRTSDTRIYKNNSQTELICAQIGEIFYGAKGDSADFETKLEARGFEVETGEKWKAEYGEQSFTLVLSEADKKLEIQNKSGTQTYLCVQLNDGNEIVRWSSIIITKPAAPVAPAE